MAVGLLSASAYLIVVLHAASNSQLNKYSRMFAVCCIQLSRYAGKIFHLVLFSYLDYIIPNIS